MVKSANQMIGTYGSISMFHAYIRLSKIPEYATYLQLLLVSVGLSALKTNQSVILISLDSFSFENPKLREWLPRIKGMNKYAKFHIPLINT